MSDPAVADIDLDLHARPLTSPGGDLPPPVPPPRPPSPHALDLDRWSRAAGGRLAEEYPDSVFARLGGAAAADFFGAAFDPLPTLVEACTDPHRRAFVGDLLDTPEYRDLHETSAGDPMLAELAAASLAQGYERHRQDTPPTPEPPPPGGKKKGKGKGKEKADAPPAPPDPKAAVASRQAAAKAAATAGKDLRDARDTLDALGGAGPGDPSPTGTLDAQAAAALFKRVRNDPVLARIFALAGAFRRLLRGKRRLKSPSGRQEWVGVRPTSDIGELLPEELARFGVPALRAEQLRRLVEGETLGWLPGGTEPKGKGPVMICCDSFGSMTGRKSEEAKALALALAWRAKQDRRWCALVSYTGDPREDVLPLPPGAPWDHAAVLGWVERFLGGGCRCDVPIRELPRLYRELGAPPGVTDVLLVTDAELAFPADWLPPFLAWKKQAAVDCTGLLVGGAAPGQLAVLCDRVIRATALTPDSDAAAAVADHFA